MKLKLIFEKAQNLTLHQRVSLNFTYRNYANIGAHYVKMFNESGP